MKPKKNPFGLFKSTSCAATGAHAALLLISLVGHRSATAQTVVRAQGNGVVISNASGQAVSETAFLIPRLFVRSEIPNNPMAVVNGVRVLTQSNVLTRYQDGSAKYVMIAFRAAVPKGGQTSVSFVNQIRCNCEVSSAMTLSDLLANQTKFQTVATLYGAQLTAGGARIDLGKMLASTNAISGDRNALVTRYWITGPIVTQVIIEDRSPSRSWDISFFHPDTRAGRPALHPYFVLTAFGRSGPFKIELIGENSDTVNRMSLQYSLDITPPSGNRYIGSPTHYNNTAWRQIFWSAGAGGAFTNQAADVTIDYNLPYLIKAGVLLNYGLTPEISDAAIKAAYDSTPSPNANCGGPAIPSWQAIETSVTWRKDIMGIGQLCDVMGAPGGRGEIAPLDLQQLRYLNAMHRSTPDARRLFSVFMGQAAAVGRTTVFYREDVITDRNYTRGSSASAYGRFLSLHARPTAALDDPSNAADRDNLGRGASNSSLGFFDVGHVPSLAWMPALITGDYYFITAQQATAARALLHYIPDAYRQNNPLANGVISLRNGLRSPAWGIREVAHAAFLSPDGSPEKAYFEDYLQRNIAAWEGRLRTPNAANATTCPTTFTRLTAPSAYCWGIADFPAKYSPKNNPLRAAELEYLPGLWMTTYFVHALQHAADLGYPSRALAEDVNMMLLHLLVGRGAYPNLVSAYNYVPFDTSHLPLLTVDAVVAASANLITSDVRSWRNASDYLHGYAVVAKSGASYLYGKKWTAPDGTQLDGTAAWDILNGVVPDGQAAADTPIWRILPRTAPVR